ncbi:MAG: hypothetical protein ACOY82_20280 [Pseudomonadota bacterium]
MKKRRSLGLIDIPERTIEYDMVLLERYTDFSAELLRLGLIGISAIGFAVSKALLPSEGGHIAVELLDKVRFETGLALIAFGLCVAAALSHRYFAADSMSWHLQAMRRYQRGEEGDAEVADAEFKSRYRRFKWSEYAIRTATVALGLGAVSTAVAILRAF